MENNRYNYISCGEGSAFDEYYSGYVPEKKSPSQPKYKDTNKEAEKGKEIPPDSGGYSPDSN